jgi:hypothetical protein
MPVRGDRRQPPPEAIRAALDRITASEGFAGAERMRRFLSFVVNRTLDGELELKEYVVGVEVFGRHDFDPRTDTIVRVEARRLRKKIQDYYAKEGAPDPVGITLSPGSYIPVFEFRDVPVSQAPPNRPNRKAILAPAGILVIVMVLLAPRVLSRRAAPAAAPVASVAVLPFVDLSPAGIKAICATASAKN